LKFLIIGGLGFIGSHLTEFLIKKNHNVKILTKTFSKKSNIKILSKKIKIEKIDITNFRKLGQCIEQFKPDVIIHLAGNTSHSKSFEKPLKDVDSNAKSTLFMLEKIRELDLNCRFLLGSTFMEQIDWRVNIFVKFIMRFMGWIQIFSELQIPTDRVSKLFPRKML
jgi:UDP-glucose 4-epimerase